MNPVALEKNFRLKTEAFMAFLPKLSDTIIQKAISYFQVQITNIVKYMDHVYYCCSQFVDLIKLNLTLDNELILIAAFKTNKLYYYDLDICNFFENFNFYYNCWNQISENIKPKFGISNKIS